MTYCWLTAIAFLPAGVGHAAEGAAAPGRAARAYHQQAREAVRDVLAEREFADLHADPHGWLRGLLGWLRAGLERTRAALDSLPLWALLVLGAWMVLTLVAVVAHLLYTLCTLVRGASGAAVRGRMVKRHDGELFGVRDLEFESVYERARRLLAEANWGDAIKYLYVAAILWLDRQGRIGFRLSKTNYDYLRELAAHPKSHAQFHRLTEQFEATVYGGRPAGAPECETAASVVKGLVDEVAPAIAR
jgi:hypothetical protein